MEIREKIKSFLHAFFHKNLGIKIAALVIAVALWCYFGAMNPIRETTLTIPSISFQDQNQAGLSVLSVSASRVELVISGGVQELSGISASDVGIWADTSSIENAGVYTLPLQVSGLPDNIILERKTPATVTVKLDWIDTIPVPVEVRATSELGESYVLDEAVASPSSVTLTGPRELLSTIEYALVEVSVSDTEDVNGAYPYVLMNTDHQAVHYDDITSEGSTVNVSIPVLMQRTLPVRVDILDGEFDEYTVVEHSVTPDRLTVLGPQAVVAVMDEIYLGTIDLAVLPPGGHTYYRFFSLPDSVTNTTEHAEAAVTITITPSVTAAFELPAPELLNIPEGYEAAYPEDGQTVSVTVTGTAAAMEALTAEDIRLGFAAADLTLPELREGETSVTVSVPLRVTLPSLRDMEAQEAVVDVIITPPAA